MDKNKHLKSTYTYTVTELNGMPAITIIDLNLLDKMSVTNNIDAIIEHIAEKEKILNLDETIIIYEDSQGVWDIFDYKSGLFEPLRKDIVI